MSKQTAILGRGFAKDKKDGIIEILNIQKSREYSTDILTIRYKGEELDVLTSSKRVPKGTYNQEVTDVPYIVLDGDVYVLEEFDKMNSGGLQ